MILPVSQGLADEPDHELDHKLDHELDYGLYDDLNHNLSRQPVIDRDPVSYTFYDHISF